MKGCSLFQKPLNILLSLNVFVKKPPTMNVTTGLKMDNPTAISKCMKAPSDPHFLEKTIGEDYPADRRL